MRTRIFWIASLVILLFALILRVLPTRDNNFFFTVDQGNDAVHAREFFERGQLILLGPETGIKGVHAGPGWFYFISAGYRFFGGHPFGALFLVILLNVAITGILMWQIKDKVGEIPALIVGTALQGFWWFYDTSRWAFNPFPLVALSIILILLLIRFLEGSQKAYFAGIILVFLSFNTEVAGAAALFLFWLGVGAWGAKKGALSVKFYSFSVVAILLATAPILFQFAKQFFQIKILAGGEGVGVFSGTNFSGMAARFAEMVSYAVIPQNIPVSLLIFVFVLLAFARSKQNKFVKYFLFLTLSLTFTSYLFFSLSRGYFDWHTVYLPVLIFISFVLMLLSLGRLGIVGLILVMIFQLSIFKDRYLQYFNPGSDQSILANSLAVIDWIYQNAEEDGFNVYTYSSSDFDYPQQYLFWWYGRKKFGYLPCEYANYPNFLKYTYIPGSDWYSKPTLGCNRFIFLIIEPDDPEDGSQDLLDWQEVASKNTKLVNEIYVGRIKVEKRVKVSDQQSRF